MVTKLNRKSLRAQQAGISLRVCSQRQKEKKTKREKREKRKREMMGDTLTVVFT